MEVASRARPHAVGCGSISLQIPILTFISGVLLRLPSPRAHSSHFLPFLPSRGSRPPAVCLCSLRGCCPMWGTGTRPLSPTWSSCWWLMSG